MKTKEFAVLTGSLKQKPLSHTRPVNISSKKKTEQIKVRGVVYSLLTGLNLMLWLANVNSPCTFGHCVFMSVKEPWQKINVNDTRTPGNGLTFRLYCFAPIPTWHHYRTIVINSFQRHSNVQQEHYQFVETNYFF